MAELYKEALGMVKAAIKITEEHNMTNDLMFLCFLDELNSLSVKY